MKWPPLFRSLRTKLVLASVVVELVLLTVLVVNSARLIHQNLTAQAELRIRELSLLLNAALAGPLAARDYATLDEVLRESQHPEGIVYLVLYDNYGKAVAASGWDPAQPTPLPDQNITQVDADSPDRHDAQTVITLAGQQHGVLRFGVSTRFLREATSTLLEQSIAIATAEVLLSIALLGLVGFWLTRHLAMLADASASIAAGDFDRRVSIETADEVGQLARAFNAMSQAVRSRVEALSESEARFHAIADYTHDWENWTGPDGCLLWVNPSVERLTGYRPDECLAMPDFPLPIVVDADRERVAREFARAGEGMSGSDVEFRVRRKDGSEFWATVAWQPIYGPDGEFLGRRSSIRDTSARKQAELDLQDKVVELQRSEDEQKRLRSRAENEQARLKSLLAAMSVGVLFEDVGNRVIYTNPAFRRIWLVPEAIDLIGEPTTDVLRHSANVLARPDHFSRHILQVIGTHEVSETFEIATADNRLITQLSYPVRDPDGRFIGRLWVYEDVTRERQTAEQLIYLAERDSLTGLYNRHRFQEELGRVLAEVDRHEENHGAILFFDLDEFKYVNDTFGHRAGDAMLIRVAGEIASVVRGGEMFSRLGGDEFAVLMPDAKLEDAQQLAERIVRGIAQIPFRFEGSNLRLTTSLGIALYPEHGCTAEELVAHADTAMYQAKEAGKHAWRVYRPDRGVSREALDRMSWQDRISRALEKGLLTLHFQGVYRAVDNTLSHLEVLVRMIDEVNPGQLILPGRFIRYAEKSGKILDIDRWVIRESLKLLGRDPALPSLAVNISGRSFDDPGLPQFIANQLDAFGVAPQRLLVELTETAAVTDLHDAQRFIHALRQTGCPVCLDDFGTGFSSFAYLKYLQVDTLKIDGLFVRDLVNDHDNQVLVKSIVDVARGMRKRTIAEFVEDAQTLEMLRLFGVDMVQGYHLDMPRADHPALTSGVA